MYRTILAFGIIAGAVAASSPALAADLPDSYSDYSTEPKLKIATAISPRSPPIRMQLTRSAGARPFLYGTTSLPNGAILQITIRIPWLSDGQERVSIGLPACRINCIPLDDRVIIKNGAFQMGPFSLGTEPLDPGVYPYEIIIETGNFYRSPDDAFRKVYTGQFIIGPDDR
jgi:hypothetical protein